MKKIIIILIMIFGLISIGNIGKGIFLLSSYPSNNIQSTANQLPNAEELKDGIENPVVENEELSLSSNDQSTTDKTVAEAVNTTLKNILLVNRTNKLTKNYIPESLTIPKIKFIASADPTVKEMDLEAAKAVETLFNAAKIDGVTLLGVSGYRSYTYQEKLYNKKVAADGKKEADKYVAQPGTSEHQSGLALDVLSYEYSNLDEGFEKTKAFKWLEKNCFKYGFIIRYPKGKESITGYNYEPWHIRYVGIIAATEISQKQLTLEEYLK